MRVTIRKIDKSVKENKDGIEVATYRCTLKGDDGVIKTNLVIVSESKETLEKLIPQDIGEARNLKLELVG